MVHFTNSRQKLGWAALRIAIGTLIMLVGRQGVASPASSSRAVVTEDSSAIPSDELVRLIEAAERAYTEVDFAAVGENAQRALDLGRASSDQSCRLHVMLGIAKSALGQDDEAKRDFIVALAIDPRLNLDRNLSPKLRAPYLEAKGFWERQKSRVALTLQMGEADSEVACRLVDPAKLVKKVRIWVRSAGEAHYESLESVAQDRFELHTHQSMKRRAVEYHAALLDEHGNTLLELGEASRPLQLGNAGNDRSLHSRNVAGDLSVNEGRQTRSYWLPATLGVSALAAASMGVYFNVQREAAAADWNGKDCERPGTTRIQQCGDIDERRRSVERMTIGLYSAGGILLIGSLGTWLLGGGGEAQGKEKAGRLVSQVACDWIVGGAQVECIGRF